jgi:TIR domain
MAYDHDVFISYKREQLWTPWTRDHFKKLLQSYLAQDLGYTPDIFVDERVTVGADWVDSLGEHLAKSRVLLAIFSADYFGSDWCVHELDMMLERSLACPRARAEDARLIVPVVVHDGELIPTPVQRLQPAPFDKYRIAHINEASPDYHEFSKAMKVLSPSVATAINGAPNFSTKWVGHHKTRFNQIFQNSAARKATPPTKFVLKRPSPPRRVPRPTI